MEQSDKLKEITEILNSDKIEPTIALNILISAIQSSFDKSHFNDLDRALISKALDCFKEKLDLGKNFMIRVK